LYNFRFQTVALDVTMNCLNCTINNQFIVRSSRLKFSNCFWRFSYLSYHNYKNIQLYWFYLASKWRACVREVVCLRVRLRHASRRSWAISPAYAPGILRQMLMLFSTHLYFVNQLSKNILPSSKPSNSILKMRKCF
jgi:hypothetical protein